MPEFCTRTLPAGVSVDEAKRTKCASCGHPMIAHPAADVVSVRQCVVCEIDARLYDGWYEDDDPARNDRRERYARAYLGVALWLGSEPVDPMCVAEATMAVNDAEALPVATCPPIDLTRDPEQS